MPEISIWPFKVRNPEGHQRWKWSTQECKAQRCCKFLETCVNHGLSSRY